MKKNFEIKCSVKDFRKYRDIINSGKSFEKSVEKQCDIYYKVRNDRLKLRIINEKLGALIYYDRREKTGKRVSQYQISYTENFSELDFILRKEFEVIVTVSKIREIYIDRNIRIHLDKVTGLGKFLEVEIIYEDLKKAKKQMKEITQMLEINENDLIKTSYSDLLINKQ